MSPVAYSPNLRSGFTGKDRYRPYSKVDIDGSTYFANDWDAPFRWDGAATTYPMGSVPATGFSAADDAGGTTFPIGTVVVYYFVYRNNTIGKETAPQLTSGIPGYSHTMVATKDILVTLPNPGGEWTHLGIYRRLANSNNFKKVAYVVMGTATYLDNTPDSSLNSLIAEYVPRKRLSLPTVFSFIVSHLNRTFGFTFKDPAFEWSQQARADAESVCDDFPEENRLPIIPDDGRGGPRASMSSNAGLYVWKERGCYIIREDPLLDFNVTEMYGGRGACSPACVVAVDDRLLILDEKGIYFWTPGGQPIAAGSPPGQSKSPIQPIFARMNLGVATRFSGRLIPNTDLVLFHVALDFEPIPNTPIVFDYGRNVFVSVDTMQWAAAVGEWHDASGGVYQLRVCDMGYVWQYGLLAYEGTVLGTVYAGYFTVASGSLLSIDTNTGVLDPPIFSQDDVIGVPGTPFQRRSAAGAVLDENRVYTATSSQAFVPYLYALNVVTAGNLLRMGCIASIATARRLSLRTADKKWVRRAHLYLDLFATGNLRVESSIETTTGATAMATKKDVVQTTSPHSLVVFNDRCWTWSPQFSQVAQGGGWALREMHVDLVTVPGARE